MGNMATQARTENLSLSTLLSVTELKELKGVQYCDGKFSENVQFVKQNTTNQTV